MRIALVTGGSAGIGQATAIELARQGAAVIATFRSHHAEAYETVAAIEAAGGEGEILRLDLEDIASISAFVGQVRDLLASRWDGASLHYLVNNAGIGSPAMFADVSEALFDLFHRVLFKGPFFLTQRLLPLLADNGAIVNVGSSSALPSRVTAGYSAYAAAKGALHTVTGFWAKELADRGIRVNTVAPGTTLTRISDDAFARQPEMIPGIAAGIALGRIGNPEDTAQVIAFLLSDAGAWVTGQVIEVSGGERL